MPFFKFAVSLGLIAAATVVQAIPLSETSTPASKSLPGCGEVNVILTGLPPNHPLVIEQGRDPVGTNISLHAEFDAAIAAGYNIRFSFMGPEKPLTILEDRLAGIEWAGTGVGMGVRGTEIPELVVRFEDILETYRKVTPDAQYYFNYRPDSTLWAIQRRFPLSTNCTETNQPGKDLGFEVFCDICET